VFSSPFEPSLFFPPVEQADEDGLLAVGGRLDPEWLIDAYSHGIFPWPIDKTSPILWWSPDPRGIIVPEQAHFSRRLLRTCRNNRFSVTLDQDFRQVVSLCAKTHGKHGGTWITPAMIKAYWALHRLGFAHSVEVWSADEHELVGGLYGVRLGGFFAAESMFHTKTDASKVALVKLLGHLGKCGFSLIDIQMLTPHTAKFGGVEVSRNEYLKRLDAALKQNIDFDE